MGGLTTDVAEWVVGVQNGGTGANQMTIADQQPLQPGIPGIHQ